MSTRALKVDSVPGPAEPELPPGSWIGDRFPDASAFFSAPAYDRFVELLFHLAENARDVVLADGETGIGKTTLIYRIQAQSPEHWRLCRINANPMLHPDQLYNALARSFGAPPNREDMPPLLDRALSRLRGRGTLPVVAVDDADELPVSSLMALIRLHELNPEPAFALFLFATPQISGLLATQQMRAMGTGRINRLQIPRLDKAQVAAYGAYFLRMEDVDNPPALPQEKWEDIFLRSQGVPGQVNELLLQALRDTAAVGAGSALRRAASRIRRLPPMTLIAGAVVCCLLGVTLAFQDEINGVFSAGAGRPDSAAGGAVPASGDPGSRVLPLPLPEIAPAPVLTADEVPDPVAEAPSAEPDQTPSEPVDEPVIEPLIPPLPSPERTSLAAAPVSEPVPAAAEKTAAEPPQRQAEGADTGVSDAKPQAPPAESPAPVAAVTAKAEPPRATPNAAAEERLLGLDPKTYTLQVLGVSDEDAARRFIRRNAGAPELVYFGTRRNAKPWFAVVHGVYPSRAAAVAAIATLPGSLSRSGAWPRSLASVQEDIRRNR